MTTRQALTGVLYGTRYTLNYKGLFYRTVWVEFPDIETVCIQVGAPPTTKKEDGSPGYTFPILFDPSTKAIVADSAVIARYLDATYPDTPPVFPAGTAALQAAFSDGVRSACGGPLFMLTIADIWRSLNTKSQGYFRTTREKRFGAKLEELRSEAQWELMEAGFGKVDEWLKANGPGKDHLLMGDRICYSDFQLASVLMWARTVCGEESEDWARIASWHGGRWKRFLEYFDRYAIVDNVN